MSTSMHACASGHMRRSTVGSDCQPGIKPKLLIAHLEQNTPPPGVLLVT